MKNRSMVHGLFGMICVLALSGQVLGAQEKAASRTQLFDEVTANCGVSGKRKAQQ